MNSLVEKALRRIGYLRRHSTSQSRGLKFCEKKPEDIGGRSDQRILDRVLIISQPKAGTYLLAEILKNCGFANTNLHLGLDRLQAYEPKARGAGLMNPRLFDVQCPLEESRNLIRFGQVAMSHCPYSGKLEEMFTGFKIFHAKRELRAAFRSYARMYLASPVKGENYNAAIDKDGISGLMKMRGRSMIAGALRINRWAGSRNVFSLRMEDLLSKPEEVVGDMLLHLGIEPPVSAEAIWIKSTKAKTLTKSDSYPDLVWTAADEALFRSIGGMEANKELGY